jgi:hypothetical protein
VAYLERIAERDEVSVSRALANLIDTQIAPASFEVKRPAHKVRRHIWISDEHLELLQRLTARMGLSRSDVVRRLLDGALEAERY